MATTSQRRKFLIALAAIIVGGLIIGIATQGWMEPIKSAVLTISSPVKNSVFRIGGGVYEFSRNITKISSLTDENEQLRTENVELRARQNMLTEAEAENARLREQLDLLPKEPFELVGAHIIGYDPDKTNSIRIINRGESSGIHLDDAVIISDGILLGKVVEVHERTAKVLLIESQKSTINVKIADKEITGIIRGEHGVGLLLDLIPQQESIEVGDEIITSGLGKDYPKDLTVGRIEEVKQSDNDIFQQAYIEPAIPTRTLKELFVIINTQSIE